MSRRIRVALSGTINNANKTFVLPFGYETTDDFELQAFAPRMTLSLAVAADKDWRFTLSGLTVTLGRAPKTEEERPVAEYWTLVTATIASPSGAPCPGDAFYARMRAMASRLITKYGRSLTLTYRTAEDDYDPTTGIVTEATAQVAFRGAVLGIQDNHVNGTTILETDKRVLAVLPVVPDVDALIDGIGDRSHRVVQVTEVAPGCVPVVYEMVARQ